MASDEINDFDAEFENISLINDNRLDIYFKILMTTNGNERNRFMSIIDHACGVYLSENKEIKTKIKDRIFTSDDKNQIVHLL
jgi:hypothetical protein